MERSTACGHQSHAHSAATDTKPYNLNPNWAWRACPSEAAATGSGDSSEKCTEAGAPSSACSTSIACALGNGGIWSCSFSSSAV